jgi:hypothetical protein
MKIIRNEKVIERNEKIGKWTSGIGTILSLICLYFAVTTLMDPEKVTAQNQLLLFFAMIVGIVLLQIGNSLGLKFGRSPRRDEKIDAGLKGLHSEFNMFHYITPTAHLLVGPSGAWALLPYHQGGKIEFSKKRWRLSGGGFSQSYMKIFGTEGLGRPDLDAESEVYKTRKFFEKKMAAADVPEIKPVLIFLNESLELDAGDSPIPALKLKHLKEFMRQKSKDRALSQEQIKKILEALPED